MLTVQLQKGSGVEDRWQGTRKGERLNGYTLSRFPQPQNYTLEQTRLQKWTKFLEEIKLRKSEMLCAISLCLFFEYVMKYSVCCLKVTVKEIKFCYGRNWNAVLCYGRFCVNASRSLYASFKKYLQRYLFHDVLLR